MLGNGKRLCEGGAFTPEISTKNCHKQKPISFAKIQKLVKEIGFLRIILTNSSIIPSPPLLQNRC